MRVSDIPEVMKLSTPEKILLVEDLWDSIASDESAPGTLLSLDELRTIRTKLRDRSETKSS